MKELPTFDLWDIESKKRNRERELKEIEYYYQCLRDELERKKVMSTARRDCPTG